MANRLTMAEIDKILTLHTTAHTNHEIADLLAINRETVGKYVARYKAQNQPDAPTAILDRLLASAEVLQITGKSYRLRGKGPGEKPTDSPDGSD